MPKKPRIPVSADQQPLQTSPFANLNLGPLAPGPTEPSETTTPSNSEKNNTKGRVLLRRETKHRGGKVVIVITFEDHISLNTITAFAKSLKQQCSCGGTVEERTIEIQGEQAPKIRTYFEGQGFRVLGP